LFLSRCLFKLALQIISGNGHPVRILAKPTGNDNKPNSGLSPERRVLSKKTCKAGINTAENMHCIIKLLTDEMPMSKISHKPGIDIMGIPPENRGKLCDH
jgi:hypothetical protein